MPSLAANRPKLDPPGDLPDSRHLLKSPKQKKPGPRTAGQEPRLVALPLQLGARLPPPSSAAVVSTRGLYVGGVSKSVPTWMPAGLTSILAVL